MSVMYPMIDVHLKRKQPVIGTENRFRHLPTYFKYTDDEGGDALNDAVDYAISKGIGEIIIDCLCITPDEDLVIQDGENTLKFKGMGSPRYESLPNTNLATRAKSGIIFDGKTIINGLSGFRGGKVVIEDMTLGFENIDASAKCLIDTDYIVWELRRLLLQEWGNTFDGSHSIFGPTTGGITPDSSKCIIEDIYIHLKSANVIAFGNHNETTIYKSPHFNFNYEDQIGISCAGVGAHKVIDPFIWFGATAHACEAFRIFNSGKDWTFEGISASHQMGGLDETCSIISVLNDTYDGTVITAKVIVVDGDIEWAIKSEATDVAMWKDENAHLATLILGTYNGELLSGGMREQLFFDHSPQYSTPGAVYAAVTGNSARPIDLTGVQHARFWGLVQASDAIDGHGVCAYNETDSDVLCEYVWNQLAGVQQTVISPWTPVRKSGKKIINYRRKGGDGADQILEKVVGIELR